jgi:hypothetical protein
MPRCDVSQDIYIIATSSWSIPSGTGRQPGAELDNLWMRRCQIQEQSEEERGLQFEK